MNKTVAIIGTNGLPGKYGGWDQLVHHLTLNLKNNFQFIVYTSSYKYELDNKVVNGAKIKLVRFKANGIQSIPYDIISIYDAVKKYDILYICGISGCVFLPFIKSYGKKIIVNPDGIEWKRNKFSFFIKKFLKLSERLAVQYSNILVADNKEIAKYIKSEYNVNAEIIEYGGDHVLKDIAISSGVKNKYNIEDKKYVFKVCRIEPENNIHVILQAFRSLPITLVIVGNWNNSKYGKKLQSKYSKFENFRLLNPIYNQKRLDMLRSNCLFYIHGHSVGGTNPSLVEAMNLGLPIISFESVFNRETTENSAIYFNSINSLKSETNLILDGKYDLRIFRKKMIEIAKKRFTWYKITNKYGKIFS